MIKGCSTLPALTPSENLVPDMRILQFLAAASFTLAAAVAVACPFCSAVSQTLRQEMQAMDAVAIATAVHGDISRNQESGEVTMKIDKVLKGQDLITAGQEVRAIYYGDVAKGRRFMISGVDPPALQWSCLPLTERSEAYVQKVTEIADQDALTRLRFYHQYLNDEEQMLSRDAYDEFAITPYEVVQQLAPDMNHDQLVEWISDPETPTDRQRLYLTMLGVCGSKDDVPMLETMLRSTQKSTRGGLDALIACYLTLAGESGIPLIDELFLANRQAPYADTYAAIMAIRFHGTEGDVIPRSALVSSLHHVLDRKDLADLVIPDLARWGDWSQIDRLVELFANADEDNNWVRVPVVNYLRACPKPEAKVAIEKLQEIDPEAVKRANTFFSIPTPARDTGNEPAADDTSGVVPGTADTPLSLVPQRPLPAAGLRTAYRAEFRPGAQTAALDAIGPLPALARSPYANPWQIGYVLALGFATIMIAQFLVLTGGCHRAVTTDS